MYKFDPILHSEYNQIASNTVQSRISNFLSRYTSASDIFYSLALCQCFNGVFALSVTLVAYLGQALLLGAPDYHLLLSGARFCFLLLVSVVNLRAFGRRTGYFFGLSRPLLQRVAIYLQLFWFSTELVFGAALLSLLPVVEASTGSQFHLTGWTYTFANLVPILYPMGLSGCVLFIQRLLKKKQDHHHHHHSSPPIIPLSTITTTSSSSSAISSHDDNLCSPSISECSSISTTSSSGGLYNRSSFSPRGFCDTPGATCEIILMEHVIDTNEAVLFVHKNLRPIKTRVEDRFNKTTMPMPTMLPQVQYNNKNQTYHHHRTASDDTGAMTVVPLVPV